MATICFVDDRVVGEGSESEAVQMAACSVGSHTIHLRPDELDGEPASRCEYFVVGKLSEPPHVRVVCEFLCRIPPSKIAATDSAPEEVKSVSGICFERGSKIYLGVLAFLGYPYSRRPQFQLQPHP